MSNYDKTNTGVLFKNDTEGKSENFPGYGGTVNIEGTEYYVSAWVKDGQRGKFFSMAFKPKEAKPAAAPTRASSAPANDFDSESIPF